MNTFRYLLESAAGEIAEGAFCGKTFALKGGSLGSDAALEKLMDRR